MREDQRSGTIAAMIYNVNRGKGKKAIKWSKIFPLYEERRPKDWSELLAITEMLNEAFGGLDLRGNKETPTV